MAAVLAQVCRLHVLHPVYQLANAVGHGTRTWQVRADTSPGSDEHFTRVSWLTWCCQSSSAWLQFPS
jgi:hypothetical protein